MHREHNHLEAVKRALDACRNSRLDHMKTKREKAKGGSEASLPPSPSSRSTSPSFIEMQGTGPPYSPAWPTHTASRLESPAKRKRGPAAGLPPSRLAGRTANATGWTWCGAVHFVYEVSDDGAENAQGGQKEGQGPPLQEEDAEAHWGKPASAGNHPEEAEHTETGQSGNTRGRFADTAEKMMHSHHREQTEGGAANRTGPGRGTFRPGTGPSCSKESEAQAATRRRIWVEASDVRELLEEDERVRNFMRSIASDAGRLLEMQVVEADTAVQSPGPRL